MTPELKAELDRRKAETAEFMRKHDEQEAEADKVKDWLWSWTRNAWETKRLSFKKEDPVVAIVCHHHKVENICAQGGWVWHPVAAQICENLSPRSFATDLPDRFWLALPVHPTWAEAMQENVKGFLTIGTYLDKYGNPQRYYNKDGFVIDEFTPEEDVPLEVEVLAEADFAMTEQDTTEPLQYDAICNYEITWLSIGEDVGVGIYAPLAVQQQKGE